MKNSIHGVILAGGKSERLGRDKALESFNGKPLISNVICAISKHVNNISIVINENTRKKDLSVAWHATRAPRIYRADLSLLGW